MSEEYEMENMGDLELYPPWKEAAAKFDQSGFTYGDTVPKEWLAEAFNLQPPDKDGMYTPREIDRYELAFMASMDRFKKCMLDLHQMDFVSNYRGGYIIIAPADQSRRALQDLDRTIHNAINKAKDRIWNVNVNMLSDEERQEQRNILTKTLDMQFRMSMKPRELPNGE